MLYFYRFSLTPIFKKLGAFIPALSLLRTFALSLYLFCVFHAKHTVTKQRCTNPCVFLFIILYIYSKYMYFWVNYFTSFRWRQFSKSWTPSFLPYPCSCTYFINSRLFVVLQTTHMRVNKVGLPTPVCFFLLYYIYSKCMYFWVKYFLNLCWRQFSKSWTSSFLPYPCSIIIISVWLLLLFLNNTKQRWWWDVSTPVCFFLLYYI